MSVPRRQSITIAYGERQEGISMAFCRPSAVSQKDRSRDNYVLARVQIEKYFSMVQIWGSSPVQEGC